MSIVAQIATAHEFRIETEIIIGDEDNPVSTSLTLFEGGLIYDFLLEPDGNPDSPQQIAIFDTHQKKFVLLDTSRNIKTVIPNHRLVRLLSALKSKGVLRNDFFADPIFEEVYDTSSGWLTLTSDELVYRTKGDRPADDTVLPIYHEFIDQFARLKVTDPRTMPPFARLKLNAAIKKYKFIPNEVQVELRVKEGDTENKMQLTSKHFVIWELSKQDRDLIRQAKENWMSYKDVTLKEFKNLETDVSFLEKDE